MSGRFGTGSFELKPASADASFRRYFRVAIAGDSWIVMDAPPEHEDCRPFVHVARLMRAAGVNRVSLGAQSFDPRELQVLGRLHGTAEVERAVRTAREAGFAHLNLDLMYGLPGGDGATFARTLDAVLALGPDHLSAYCLGLEPGTALAESVAAGATGLIRACLDASVKYARERKTFGQPIGEHQLVKEMIAQMVSDYDAARLLWLRAGWLKNQGRRNTRETSLAKWHATDHAVQSALDAIQVHGANGYSNEFPVERYLRNSKAAVIYEGTSQLHTLIQADYALGYREDRPLRCEPWPAQGFERPKA